MFIYCDCSDCGFSRLTGPCLIEMYNKNNKALLFRKTKKSINNEQFTLNTRENNRFLVRTSFRVTIV